MKFEFYEVSMIRKDNSNIKTLRIIMFRKDLHPCRVYKYREPDVKHKNKAIET